MLSFKRNFPHVQSNTSLKLNQNGGSLENGFLIIHLSFQLKARNPIKWTERKAKKKYDQLSPDEKKKRVKKCDWNETKREENRKEEKN